MTAKSQTEILSIIQKALEIQDPPITMESSPNTVPSWDSLGQINIIVALDEALGGGVSDLQEMATAGSVRRIVEILAAHGLMADA